MNKETNGKTALTELIEKIGGYIQTGILILGMDDIEEQEKKFTERQVDYFKVIRGEAISLLPKERDAMSNMYHCGYDDGEHGHDRDGQLSSNNYSQYKTNSNG